MYSRPPPPKKIDPKPHSKLLTDLERFKIVIKQSVSLPGSIDGLQNRDLGDELRKLKVSGLNCALFKERKGKVFSRAHKWIRRLITSVVGLLLL